MKATMISCGLSIEILVWYQVDLLCIFTHVGIIDNDYRLPIAVILINLNSDNYEIEKGDRIGQISFSKFTHSLIIIKNINTF